MKWGARRGVNLGLLVPKHLMAFCVFHLKGPLKNPFKGKSKFSHSTKIWGMEHGMLLKFHLSQVLFVFLFVWLRLTFFCFLFFYFCSFSFLLQNVYFNFITRLNNNPTPSPHLLLRLIILFVVVVKRKDFSSAWERQTRHFLSLLHFLSFPLITKTLLRMSIRVVY